MRISQETKRMRNMSNGNDEVVERARISASQIHSQNNRKKFGPPAARTVSLPKLSFMDKEDE